MAASSAAGCSTSANANDDIPTYEYIDINTKPFHVATFENLWKQTLNPKYYSIRDVHQETDEEFAEDIGIPPGTVEELKVICNPDTLRCHPENQPPDTDVVPADPGLMTLRMRKRRQDYRETLIRAQTCRQDLYAAELENLAIGKKPVDPEDLLPEGEIILSVNVLFPVITERFKHFKARQNLQVLGSQKLTDLRDAICCLSDLQVCGEFSDTPDMAPEFISKDLFKSAFLFLGGIFYNDMRYPECKDLSQTVREWAESHDMPTFQTAKMEETTFRDLKLKVGYPYLYCHQGDCEHVVLITDIRLAHRDDCLDLKLYPLLTYKHRMISRRCAVCNLYISRWMTTNDSFAPTDPCLFCDICFRMLHYDPEGKKLGDFQAFPYVDPGAFN
ncbi:snRNA-activating protein complex subunit 3 [Anguilla anguilla]|uniref:snRNA-activating protein complex subunit 3 n=1 Tax=Anguilla anguilla TaxID=7936 RepID=UPI0015A9647C|nr:snRNA-activating protein complex subunit 3 [Anguilla anguilla]